MKKITFTCAAALSMIILSSCGASGNDEIVLRIANSEEYIDYGFWDDDEAIELDGGTVMGERPMINDFEDWFYEQYGKKVRVEYSTYGSNEEMYNMISMGDVFDMVCPSDYMIMKLMEEDALVPLSDEFFDEDIEENYYINGVSPYISKMFDFLRINDESIGKYSAGYMWGNMGIVYNPEGVDEEDTAHWEMLNDPKYFKRVTMKDGVRDSYIVAANILNRELIESGEFLNREDYYGALTDVLNDTSQETVDKIESVLTDMRNNCYSLENDSGKADIITGKVLANMQWSGDAVYTILECEEEGVTLCYRVPEEGSNLWFDGWVMMKDGLSGDPDKQLAAEAFINFLSRPDNVVRNMCWIGYTSAISGGDDPLIGEYLEYCYGAEDECEEDELTDYDISYFFGEEYILETTEDMAKGVLFAAYPDEETLGRCVIMRDFTREENDRIMRMWTNIRCFSLW